jgi:mannan endo-1,6-alpha-mannosidase
MTILAAQTVCASLTVDVNDANSIKSAAATIAYDMVTYYNGNQSGQIPGKIPGTWWEGGAMFMTLIQYWHWTGDDSYNDIATQGMLWQAGEHDDYMPSNWSNYLVGRPSQTCRPLPLPSDSTWMEVCWSDCLLSL